MSDTTDNLATTSHPCNYCGDPTTGYHSGSWECQRCWDWRKLDGPAARYWVAAFERLYHDPEGGSAPDAHDWRMWRQWGMDDSMGNALRTLMALEQAYTQLIEDQGGRKQRRERNGLTPR